MEPGYQVTHLDEIDTIRFPDEPLPEWRPLRRELGITAFGTNAYVAEQAGDLVIERHDELAEDDDPGGSEEIYVVVRGAARFTVDDTSSTGTWSRRARGRHAGPRRRRSTRPRLHAVDVGREFLDPRGARLRRESHQAVTAESPSPPHSAASARASSPAGDLLVRCDRVGDS
jgi:hypothetical protein